MKTILRLIFLPFKVLGGASISGVLLSINKKLPWLVVPISALIVLVAMYFTYGV
jgi:hypothetical protein